jgi:hypothetical protein
VITVTAKSLRIIPKSVFLLLRGETTVKRKHARSSSSYNTHLSLFSFLFRSSLEQIRVGFKLCVGHQVSSSSLKEQSSNPTWKYKYAPYTNNNNSAVPREMIRRPDLLPADMSSRLPSERSCDNSSAEFFSRGGGIAFEEWYAAGITKAVESRK